MRKILLPVLAAVMMLLFLGCPVPPGPGQRTGSLEISFAQDGIAARTIVPSVDMTIASYDVQGSGPGGASFTQLGIIASPLTVSALPTGNWTISVSAKNAGAAVIGSGSAAATVSGGQTASATVTVTPLAGTGTLTVNISWAPGLIANPVVAATLTPLGGVGASFQMTPAGDGLSANGTSAACLAGYHSLSLTVADTAQQIYGLTEVVRIIAGNTTTATITLTAADVTHAVGSLNIVLVPDMRAPIDMSFAGQVALLTQGTSMTVTATPSVAADSYQWFLNGSALSGQIGASITIGNGLQLGKYRLDLVVGTANTLGSGHIAFEVIP